MEDRFSLLYLEPGEIYFIDVAATFCQDPDAKERRIIPASQQKSTASTKKPEDIKSKGLYLNVCIV